MFNEQQSLILYEAAQILKSKISNKPLLSDWRALEDYVRFSTPSYDVEHFRVLFLDTRNRLIADETLSTGTINHCSVYTREVMRHAIMNNANALILVHNHPSNFPEPSAADITMTQHLIKAASIFEIVIHDHLIVTFTETYSMRSHGDVSFT